jgi:hypothetical protein
MPESLTNQIETLQQLNLQLRHQLEQAEAFVPGLNRAAEQLCSLGLLDPTMLFGEIIQQGNYDQRLGPHDSGWVLQAAFGVGQGGLGTITWDTDDYITALRHNYAPTMAVSANFTVFDGSTPAVKALLMPHVATFVNRIGTMAGVGFN